MYIIESNDGEISDGVRNKDQAQRVINKYFGHHIDFQLPKSKNDIVMVNEDPDDGVISITII